MSANHRSPRREFLAKNPVPGPTEAGRWTARRKAQVVDAIRDGTLTLERACADFGLTREELEFWTQALARFGVEGLRQQKSVQYRP